MNLLQLGFRQALQHRIARQRRRLASWIRCGVETTTPVLTNGLQADDRTRRLAGGVGWGSGSIEETLAVAPGIIVNTHTDICAERLVAVARCLPIREPVGKSAGPAVIRFTDSYSFELPQFHLQSKMPMPFEQAMCQCRRVINFTHQGDESS